MPVDKLEKPRDTDVDPSSLTLNFFMKRMICCSSCGESQFTLRRVREKDENGEMVKVRPAKYICSECYKRENIHQMR